MTDKREIDKKNIPPRRMTFSRAIVPLNYIYFFTKLGGRKRHYVTFLFLIG